MSRRDMKEELTCPICMELFRQPRRLHCGHSYCHVCLRAMLDRNTEERGLYANHSQSIICPECRDEVIIEIGRGIEVIPPDFKLSKLVDLFKFMKKNDSSDSSGDEQQSCKPTTDPVTSFPSESGQSGVAVASVSFSVTGILTELSSQHTDSHPSLTSHQLSSISDHQVTGAAVAGQSVIVPPAADYSATTTPGATLSTQLQQSSSSAPGVCTGIAANLTSPQVQPSRTYSVSTESTDSSPVSSSSRSAENNSIQYAAVNTANVSHGFVPHNTTATNNTDHTNAGTNLITISPSGIISNAESYTPAQTSCQQQISSFENQLEPELNGSAHGELSSEQGIDVEVSRPVGIDRIDDDELNSYSELGAVGGVASGVGNNRLPSTKEQQIDASEILSDWVNENHCYSQICRNLSHSSVSLPAEVGSEELQSFNENLPELNILSNDADPALRAESVADRAVRSQSVADRAIRAQSVPTETEEWQRSVKGGGLKESAATKGHNVKARKVKRGIFSRFVDSDTNTDSSENERAEEQRSADKPKRWLMTRFLRSVILSDSSSSDDSDDNDDDETVETKKSSKRNKETTHLSQKQSLTVTPSRPQCITAGQSQQNLPQTGELGAVSSRKTFQVGRPENLLNTNVHSDLGHEITPERKPSDHISAQSQAVSKRQNISRRDTSSEECVAVLQSIDSNTSPKELARQSGTSHSSVDSTTSRKIYSQKGVLPNSDITSFNPNFHTSDQSSPSIPSSRGRRSGRTGRNEIEQTSSNLPGVGSPPTFYDNLTTMHSGNEEITRYDNVLVRDPRFNPCNEQDFDLALARDTRFNLNPGSEQDIASLASRCMQDRTLYDNVDNHHIRLPQTSPTRNHTHIHRRNPVTDIEDLKTGYELVHMENKDIGGAGDGVKDVSVNDGQDHIKHMGELDHTTRCLFLSSQESQHGSGQLDLVQSHHPLPANHANLSGDHPSLYDNISNPRRSQSSTNSVPPLSIRDNPIESRNLSEGNRPHRLDCLAERERNTQTDCTTGPYNTKRTLHTPGRSDDDLQYVDNYFDHYSGHFRRSNVSSRNLTPPYEAIREENVSERRTGDVAGTVETSETTRRTGDVAGTVETSETTRRSGDVAGTVETSETTSSSAARGRVAVTCSKKSNAENVCSRSDGGDEGVDDDDGCHSGTSMLQNKKKPRSRLTKFLTSFLSLSSSSSDDEENYPGKSSSESSDW